MYAYLNCPSTTLGHCHTLMIVVGNYQNFKVDQYHHKLTPLKLLQSRHVSRDKSLDVKDSDGGVPFKVVSYQRRRNQNMVVGKAKGKGLGGRGRFVSLFVSRFEPDVETEKVKQYVNSTFDVNFECEKHNTRYNSYASFNIYKYCSDTSKFYSAENWPENILVR